MSCRTALVLLQCLNDSYKMAADFDARPGLKFLIQKVAKADVACNMYKQAGVSLTFYIHTLLEICAHQDNICVNNTKNMLALRSSSDSSQEEGQLGHAEVKGQHQEENPEQGNECEKTESLAGRVSVEVEEASAQKYTGSLQQYVGLFTYKLKAVFDEVCTLYVDLYLDKEGPNAADLLSSQTLVFLLVPQDDIPTLKRDRSIKEMVADKLRKRKSSGEKEDGSEGGGSVEEVLTASSAVSVQPQPVQGE